MESIINASTRTLYCADGFIEYVGPQSMNDLFENRNIILDFFGSVTTVCSQRMEGKIQRFFDAEIIRKVEILRGIAPKPRPLVAVCKFEIAISFDAAEGRIKQRRKLKRLVTVGYVLRKQRIAQQE